MKARICMLIGTLSLGFQVPALAQVERLASGAGFEAVGNIDATAAVVLVHDWFGVTPATRHAAQHIASLGYRVVTVDLYGGRSAEDHATAGQLLGSVNADSAGALIARAIGYAGESGRRVGVVAFSAGALPALRAATRHREVEALASVYGGSMENVPAEALRTMRASLLLVTGSADAWAMSSIDTVRVRLEGSGKAAEVYVYPGAGHGYAQPFWSGGANLDSEATRVTWMLIDDFLDRHLRG